MKSRSEAEKLASAGKTAAFKSGATLVICESVGAFIGSLVFDHDVCR